MENVKANATKLYRLQMDVDKCWGLLAKKILKIFESKEIEQKFF